MNYKLHYDNLIERAKNRIIKGYTEKHHIMPRCMNGSNDKDNLVNLTAREHFIAHILLVKIYPKESRLIKAVDMMCKGQAERKNESKNRMYGWLKEKFSKEMSNSQKGKGNSQFDTMWIYKLGKNKKIKKEELPVFLKQGWLKGRKNVFSKEQKEKISKLSSERLKGHTYQKGEKNSQFGTVYIYNLDKKVSKRIKKEELPVFLEQGWLKGRKIKF